jgi:hypothetical protein
MKTTGAPGLRKLDLSSQASRSDETMHYRDIAITETNSLSPAVPPATRPLMQACSKEIFYREPKRQVVGE